MTLDGRHELDPAVAIPMVVPDHKRRHPLAGPLFGVEMACGGGQSAILLRPEAGFGLRNVVRNPWPGEGSENNQHLHAALQRRRTQLIEKPAAAALALSAWTTNGCLRRLLIRSLGQNLLNRAIEMPESSRSQKCKGPL